MPFERTINRDKAKALRQLGWKYQDIAEELGCSREWCCAQLKEVKPEKEMMLEAAKAYMGWV